MSDQNERNEKEEYHHPWNRVGARFALFGLRLHHQKRTATTTTTTTTTTTIRTTITTTAGNTCGGAGGETNERKKLASTHGTDQTYLPFMICIFWGRLVSKLYHTICAT